MTHKNKICRIINSMIIILMWCNAISALNGSKGSRKKKATECGGEVEKDKENTAPRKLRSMVWTFAGVEKIKREKKKQRKKIENDIYIFYMTAARLNVNQSSKYISCGVYAEMSGNCWNANSEMTIQYEFPNGIIKIIHRKWRRLPYWDSKRNRKVTNEWSILPLLPLVY